MIKKSYHFIGIGGIGMSGLARILLKKNASVTGSDIASSYVTDGLIQDGAKVFIGHSAEYIKPDTTVVYTTGVKEDNQEYQAALHHKCPLLHRSDLLHCLTAGYKTLAVAGTHGKTTTSSLLTTVLKAGELDPSYAVGGIIAELNSNAGYGKGEYFIAEADESDGTFLKYHPHGAIITNIDFDHMDHFGSEEALIHAFNEFASKVSSPEHLFWCGDDLRLCDLKLPGFSYGLGMSCSLRASNLKQENWQQIFDIEFQGKHYSEITIPLIGKHNVLNALAVFGLALSLGIGEKTIRHAFSSFKGVGRRCELKGNLQNVLILDDYAHHPTEILTTLDGVRKAIGERRLVVVYQPHRYSRTKDCLGSFRHIFESADILIVTEIFGAGETPIPGITHEKIVEEIKNSSTVPVRYIPRKEIKDALFHSLQPHDVVITLGAGDITKVGGELAALLQQKRIKPLRIGMICGGRSVEHEVALNSAKYIQTGLKQECYDIAYFGITKKGQWISGTDTLKQLEILSHKNSAEPKEERQIFPPEILLDLLKCDVIFPIIHGAYCEDGMIQGMFEILDKPYTGCDHRSGAICMDKAITKTMALAAGLDTTPFVKCSHHEWRTQSEEICHRIKKELTFPLYVKPIHLGSSIGVQKVEEEDTLYIAINNALRVDTHIIVENEVKNAREIEFAVLGNDTITVLPPAEYCSVGKFMGYHGKYGANAVKMNAKAHLPAELQKKGMEFAKKAYLAAGCTGFARVDFFLDPSNRFWFNEINPIPGCTPTSQFPLVCEANGFKSTDIVNRIIILALQRKRLQNRVAV